MKKIFLLLLITFAVQWLPAQPPGERIFAPLYLYTNGPGRIYPNYDGQMLRVGRTYALKAIAAPGYKIASWQPVNIITSTVIEEDANGNFVTNEISQVIPVNQYVMHRELTFRMQPAETIVEPYETITLSKGWQANFVPNDEFVPRPPKQEIIENGL